MLTGGRAGESARGEVLGDVGEELRGEWTAVSWKGHNSQLN